MTVLTTERMLDVESGLERSFFVTATALVLACLWPVFLRLTTLDAQPWAGVSVLVWFPVVFGAYVWFAVASMRAAECVGRSKWLVGAWVLAAPFVAAFLQVSCVAMVLTALVRGAIPVPLMGTVVAVSPLSLKFILARELRDDIHDKTFEDE
jgi:hypothetical protein